MSAVDDKLTAVTAQLDKVLTEVTTVNDELKAQIETLTASRADPAVVAALEAASQRLDDLTPDAEPVEPA